MFWNVYVGHEEQNQNILTCSLLNLLCFDDKPNENYNLLEKLLPTVITPGQIVVFPKTPALFYLLPNDLSQYFTYHNPLTTSAGAKGVTWIDFREPIKISSSQLNKYFRKLALCNVNYSSGYSRNFEYIFRTENEILSI